MQPYLYFGKILYMQPYLYFGKILYG